MKLFRNAVILVVVVALLGVAYYFVNKSKNTDSTGTAATTTNNDLKVTDFTSDKVSSVTVTNPDLTFTIVKNGTDWKLTAPTGINADTSKLSDIVINSTDIIADKIVEKNSSDLSQYGLDKPTVIDVKLTDGTEKVLQMGNETPTKDDYYFKVKDAPAVYTVATSTAEQFLAKKNDLRNKALLALKTDDITSLSMDRKGQNVFQSTKIDSTDWTLDAPIQGSANSDALGPMLTALSTITASEYEGGDAPNPADYGLDKPSYAFDFGTSSQKYTLLLGNEKTKGSEIYAKFADSSQIFTLDETPFTFLDKPLKEIVSVFAYITNIDTVTKIDFTMDGKTDNMTLDVYKDASGKEDSDKDKFTVNGQDATGKDKDDKQPFRNFYQALIGVSLDDVDLGSGPSAGATPDISVKYYLNKVPNTMQVDFISKDADYYYVMRNGQYAHILVRKDKGDMGVQGLKDSYKTMMDFLATQKK